jgi:transposase-like protein
MNAVKSWPQLIEEGANMDFSGKQYPKEVIVMTVRWYLAYPLSYRHVEELAKERGIMLDHATVQRWVAEYGSAILAKVKKYTNRSFTDSWRFDETYIKVKGVWTFLYRVVDSEGDTIDFYLSKTRDTTAALKCLRNALASAGKRPRKINSDGSQANEKAVTSLNAELAAKVYGPYKPITYTKVKYCNNIIEQDHRRIKKITNPMLGFKNFEAAVDTLNGIEAYAMLRKGQSIFAESNGIEVSIADQYYKIAA